MLRQRETIDHLSILGPIWAKDLPRFPVWGICSWTTTSYLLLMLSLLNPLWTNTTKWAGNYRVYINCRSKNKSSEVTLKTALLLRQYQRILRLLRPKTFKDAPVYPSKRSLHPITRLVAKGFSADPFFSKLTSTGLAWLLWRRHLTTRSHSTSC